MTIDGIILGKKLFFDPLLSTNGKISCATCHNPKLAFSDAKRFSIGHSGNRLKRNTPALTNLAWSTSFFWDGGVKNLESLSFAALMSPDEMGTDLTVLCENLNKHESYPLLFKNAFQTDSISSAHITRALAQYLRTLISANAKYDSIRLGLSSFSGAEEAGLRVFTKNCAVCHTPPLFFDNGFHHNGLPQRYSEEDLNLTTGRFRITRDSLDLGKYKTPTLRNASFTAPYMHDGRFESIDQVLNHYQNPDPANQYQDSLVKRIEFSDEEKTALKTFLKTLNDLSCK